MPYVNKPRPYKKEYEQQQARGELERRMERQRGRRAIDKTGTDANGNGKADKREGKDVAHVVALDKGGSNKDGLRIQSAKKNRSFKRDSKGNLVSEVSKRERKK
jgi:prolyl-tRNA synthetase